MHVIVLVEGFKEGIDEYINQIKSNIPQIQVREIRALDLVVLKENIGELEKYIEFSHRIHDKEVHVFEIARKEDIIEFGKELI